jgi:hypothetical protein
VRGPERVGQSNLEKLVELSREALTDQLSPAEQQNGLARFERSTVPPLRRRIAWGWGLAAAAAVAGAVAVTGALRPRSDAITFRVEGGTVSDGGYIRQTEGSAALHFSEGTEFALAAGSRARVTSLDAQGAQVLIENGAARVHVTPRPRAHWSVSAGPYTIRVTGTAFDVAWSGRDEVLDLSLHNGSVVVSGPLAAKGLVLEPGQHLLANVKAGVIRLDHPRGEAPAGAHEAAAEAPAAPEATDDGAPGRLRRPAATRAGQPGRAAAVGTGWPARLARGDFQGIVADAERQGIDATLRGAQADDLAALADAARYARRTELAQHALLAERRRFPRSVAGRDAAFFMGGLVEEGAGAAAASAALDWYDRYLRESPSGTYASQALGRKMLMKERLGEREAARAVAVEYLRRFPTGPYADRARAVLDRVAF